MALNLHCKRSKMFIRHDGKRDEVVRCPIGQTTAVPDWVKEELGYKQGIIDGSILDLTPPKPVVVHTHEPAPEPVEQEEKQEEKQEEEKPKEPVKTKSNAPKGLQQGLK